MKKIIASAVGLMLAGGVAATTASAVESQFGGYWQVESVFRDNFVQPDSAQNYTHARTRLYYTAKFSDNLKFVNKFEFDSDWGDSVAGDIGADGNVFEFKNSYVDFTMGMVNAKVGIQGTTIARGFIFSDDFSGAVVTADFGMVKLPVAYISGPQEDVNAGADNDTHVLSVMPKIKINDNISLTPNVTWKTTTSTDTDLFWLGVDVDAKFDAVSAWGSFIYEGGQEGDGITPSVDKNAWLAAVGADVNIVHGQVFYASGDDGTDATETNDFTGVSQSYYWSEIMGLGDFDYNSPTLAGTPGDHLTNIWAANAGVTVKPMDKLTINFDVWYAQLAEDNAAGDNELGLEFDGKVSYQLMDSLNADVIFAYLVAGDAVGPEDVMEGGVQLTLSF